MIQHSYLTAAEVAAQHSMSHATVLRRIRSGDLPAIDVGTPARPVYRIAAADAATLTRSVVGGSGSTDAAIAAAVAALVATAPPLSDDAIATVADALGTAAVAGLRARAGAVAA